MHGCKLNKPNTFKPAMAFTLLALIVLLIYSNAFHAAWHFDSKPNILDNTRLHIDTLSSDSLLKTFFAKKQGGQNDFYRPLPSLSFALNWYTGRDNPFGYHLLNIAIHILSAFILYLCTFNLLRTPKAITLFSAEDAYFISLLTAVLWAVNPIQIQAVTYIVQRMASMAAMFYVLGIYFFLKGRMRTCRKVQVCLYAACAISFLFALMSKENAAMMPVSLLLIEIIFFQDVDTVLQKIKKHLLLLAIAGIALLLLGIIVLKTGALDFIFRGYASRFFTLMERLLTQPRIVLFYISQIFYPLPDRLSITHDIVVSRSLLSPWTTLPAIMAILVLLGIGVSQIKKRPLVAFSIFFFFLNHLVESTILPLELVFEHRNYLPSFFIFLPVAAALRYLFNFYRARNRSMTVILAAFTTMVIIGLGCFTYIRNRDWRTETTLWRDAMQKAPRDARPPWNLAIELAWDKGVQPLQLEVALVLFEKALSLNHASRYQEARILRNMGIIYHTREEFEKAVQTYQKGIEINPQFRDIRNNLIDSLIMMGKWKEALEHADQLLGITDDNSGLDHLIYKGFILLWQNKPEEALIYFRKALKLDSNSKNVLLNTGTALSLMGKNKNAEFFFLRALKTFPEDIRLVFALIENSARAGDLQKAEKYTEQLFARFTMQRITEGIELFSNNYETAPMSAELIVPVIKKKMEKLSEDITSIVSFAHVE